MSRFVNSWFETKNADIFKSNLRAQIFYIAFDDIFMLDFSWNVVWIIKSKLQKSTNESNSNLWLNGSWTEWTNLWVRLQRKKIWNSVSLILTL